MNVQQRRLFFRVATSNNENLKEVGPLWKRCFRPCGWIAAILTALLIGCTSLTPERVNVIAAIAGQAAAYGTAEWLTKHPEHRASFESIIAALSAIHRNGATNAVAENAFVELMSSLPTDALKGPDGELYVAGDGGLIVWDAHLKKAVAVDGPAVAPVLRSTLIGLKRALAPKPPMPSTTKLALPPGVAVREMEGAPTNVAFRGFIGINNFEAQRVYSPTNKLHVSNGTNSILHQQTLIVASTFDVSLNDHGIQQVNVRWVMEPNALYTVQRMEDKTWEGYAQNTNTVATPWVWTTLWPAPVAVGSWRVLRR